MGSGLGLLALAGRQIGPSVAELARGPGGLDQVTSSACSRKASASLKARSQLTPTSSFRSEHRLGTKLLPSCSGWGENALRRRKCVVLAVPSVSPRRGDRRIFSEPPPGSRPDEVDSPAPSHVLHRCLTTLRGAGGVALPAPPVNPFPRALERQGELRGLEQAAATSRQKQHWQGFTTTEPPDLPHSHGLADKVLLSWSPRFGKMLSGGESTAAPVRSSQMAPKETTHRLAQEATML